MSFLPDLDLDLRVAECVSEDDTEPPEEDSQEGQEERSRDAEQGAGHGEEEGAECFSDEEEASTPTRSSSEKPAGRPQRQLPRSQSEAKEEPETLQPETSISTKSIVSLKLIREAPGVAAHRAGTSGDGLERAQAAVRSREPTERQQNATAGGHTGGIGAPRKQDGDTPAAEPNSRQNEERYGGQTGGPGIDLKGSSRRQVCSAEEKELKIFKEKIQKAGDQVRKRVERFGGKFAQPPLDLVLKPEELGRYLKLMGGGLESKRQAQTASDIQHNDMEPAPKRARSVQASPLAVPLQPRPGFQVPSFVNSMIFKTNNATIGECISRQLFGLPANQWPLVRDNVAVAKTALFLYNVSTREIEGIFVATQDPAKNLVPLAWKSTANDRDRQKQRDNRPQGSPYPAQVAVRKITPWTPVSILHVQHLLQWHNNGATFDLVLDQLQTHALIQILWHQQTKPVIHISPWLAPGLLIPH